MIPSKKNFRKCKLINSDRKQICCCLGMELREVRGKTTKDHSETFRSDEFVYNPDCGDTFLGV